MYNAEAEAFRTVMLSRLTSLHWPICTTFDVLPSASMSTFETRMSFIVWPVWFELMHRHGPLVVVAPYFLVIWKFDTTIPSIVGGPPMTSSEMRMRSPLAASEVATMLETM